MNPSLHIKLLVPVVMAMLPSMLLAGPATGPLQVHPINPRYFTDGAGKTIYCTGSHNWFNMQDMSCSNPPDVFDWTGHMNFLQSHNHSFTRGWHTETALDYGAGDCIGISLGLYSNPMPFKRTGPGYALDGKLKFDVYQYYQPYFDRIRSRAADAGNRGIYIGIMLFQGWSIDSKDKPGRDPMYGHPFNINNNINGINGDPNNDGEGWEIHTLQIPAITAIQEDYVRKVIDELNDLDNIIWEISNESHADSVQWQYHMIDFIKSYEAAYKPKQHLVWMNAYDIPNYALFDSACHAEVVSPNRKDGTNYRNNPPATTGNKIIVLDTDHIWGVGGTREWPWKSFTRGYHPIFMDPIVTTSPTLNPMDPLWVAIREAMGQTRLYADKMDLANMTPRNSLSSTTYCLANPGMEYLAYQPTAGADFTINLQAGSYHYEWFNPTTGQVTETGSLNANGGNKNFNNPYSGTAVLYLYNTGPRLPIYYDLGNPDTADGMTHPQVADGQTTPFAIGGRSCKTNTDPSNDFYFYFGINYLYSGSQSEFYITIDYYDTGSGSLTLQYDSNTGDDIPARYKVGGTIVLTDSNTWKQKSFHITDAYFGDRQNGDADFRVGKTDGSSFYLDLVTVSDILPPAISQDPASLKLHKGQTALFNIMASGDGPLQYQWQHDGVDLSNAGNISGVNTDTLQIINIQDNNAGDYRCRVSNQGGNILSESATLSLATVGDFDVDNDVDQEDFGHLQQCLSGVGQPQNNPNCLDALLDDDDDVDTLDSAILQGCMTGPNHPPQPDCAD